MRKSSSWSPAAALLGLMVASGNGAPAQPMDTALSSQVVHLRITSVPEPGPETVRVLITPEPDSEAGRDPWEEVVDLARGSAELELSLRAGGRWRVQARAPGLWSAPAFVDEDSSGVQQLSLWAAAALTATLEVPDDRERLEEIRVRLSRVPGVKDDSSPQPDEPVKLVCPVKERKLDACSLPAGRWNLPGLYTTRRVPGQAFATGETTDLGALELQRGGSVLGRLRTEQGFVDPLRARVWLRPLADPVNGNADLEEELGQLARMGEISSVGDFQIVGVPPGTYEVQASHPGFVTASRTPVEVARGEWTEIPEPLLLELPLRLAVAVEPTAEPSGEPWGLQLYRAGRRGRLSSAAEGETDAAGLWDSPLLPAGQYELWVVDAQENVLARQDVLLDRDSPFARVEMPLVYVEGRVVLGDRPLEGQIRFEAETTKRTVETESDEAGEFFVVLPHDGEWQADMQSESPPVRTRDLPVDIEPLEGLAVAEVTIEIPGTTLLGRVVDALGGPSKEAALIEVTRIDGGTGPTGGRTDPVGSFELHGMVPGRYVVTAETPQASSEPVRVDLAEGGQASVTLVLQPEREIHGRVLSASGPVPGATVFGQFLSGTGRAVRAKLAQERTSATGEFRVQVPAEATGVRLVIMVPGFALHVGRVPERETLEIVLDRLAGTVRLAGIQDAIRLREDSTLGLLMVDGEAVDLGLLPEWARRGEASLTEEGGLVVSAMPAAQYALCRLTIQEAWLVLDAAALPSEQACTEGLLTPGGELRLSLPS